MLASDPDERPSTERILNNALDLFSQKGYDATSVREICAAAGITKPTLYHFFGSKEGVYRALVDGSLSAFRDVLMQTLDTGSTQECLARFARVYFERGRNHPELARFVLRLIHNPPQSAPATDFRKFHEVVTGGIEHAIEQGVARGELVRGPAWIRSLVLLGSLGQALRAHLLLGRPAPGDELADALVETLLSGWRPR